MTRKRRTFLVVTFAETTDAMAAERLCGERGVPGRIIPIPRQLSAGCGLAWKTELEERESVRAVLERAGIHWHEMAEVELWA